MTSHYADEETVTRRVGPQPGRREGRRIKINIVSFQRTEVYFYNFHQPRPLQLSDYPLSFQSISSQ
jgi:hypothetical protein